MGGLIHTISFRSLCHWQDTQTGLACGCRLGFLPGLHQSQLCLGFTKLLHQSLSQVILDPEYSLLVCFESLCLAILTCVPCTNSMVTVHSSAHPNAKGYAAFLGLELCQCTCMYTAIGHELKLMSWYAGASVCSDGEAQR